MVFEDAEASIAALTLKVTEIEAKLPETLPAEVKAAIIVLCDYIKAKVS